MPCEPTYDRSLRSLAEFTPQAAASSSLETVSVLCSASSPSMRRYTASLATVASGIERATFAAAEAPRASPGPACGGDVTLASPDALGRLAGRGGRAGLPPRR